MPALGGHHARMERRTALRRSRGGPDELRGESPGTRWAIDDWPDRVIEQWPLSFRPSVGTVAMDENARC